MTPIEGAAVVTSVGDYLGFVRTATRIYPFSSANDRGYAATLGDSPSPLEGEDVEGATAVVAVVWGAIGPTPTAPPPAHGREALATWDGRDTSGRRVPAGTYWVRAESPERTEARRGAILR